MRVTVEKKETGQTGLKLEAIADDAPVKPKKEEADNAPKRRKTAAKKAAPKKPAAKAAAAKSDGKRTIVPQLPRKS